MKQFCVNPAEHVTGHEDQLPMTITQFGTAIVEADSRQQVIRVLGGEDNRTSVLPYGEKLRGAMLNHREEYGIR